MTTRPRRRSAAAVAWAALIALMLLSLATAGPARADGDPASDELIAQNVFYPYSSPVPQYLQRQLNTEVTAAHHAGLFLKIAIIARPSDLGSITALYGAPQRYAQFLDTELSLSRKVPLLVVMHSGFGSEGLPAELARAVLAARPPTANTGAVLATATLSVVDRIDSDLTTGPVGRAHSGGDPVLQTRTIVLLALILAALLVGGVLIVARIFFPPAA